MKVSGSSEILFGFDSAWADNPKSPGAICAVSFKGGSLDRFWEPRLVSFEQALVFIEEATCPYDLSLIALDQPTIVPNEKGMRPVERAVASLISWLGGGVQPSNKNKRGMFCESAPIWAFLQKLSALENPEESRIAAKGRFLIEVFPALALPTFSQDFFGRLAAPRYNPARRKTFKSRDWKSVALVASEHFGSFELHEAKQWCLEAAQLGNPTKSDQDRLDSMLCMLIALYWRFRDREDSVLVGDLQQGYMVSPVSLGVRERLEISCSKVGIPIV